MRKIKKKGGWYDMGLIRCRNGHIFSQTRFGTVCPYCNVETAAVEQTETAGEKEANTESKLLAWESSPVCGWIVCTSGPGRGKDYRIKSGKNYIEQEKNRDIMLRGDDKMSGCIYGVIIFKPEEKKTLLLTEASNNLTYHNNAPIAGTIELKPYDIIGIGDSKFVFVPFCGENFMWED